MRARLVCVWLALGSAVVIPAIVWLVRDLNTASAVAQVVSAPLAVLAMLGVVPQVSRGDSPTNPQTMNSTGAPPSRRRPPRRVVVAVIAVGSAVLGAVAASVVTETLSSSTDATAASKPALEPGTPCGGAGTDLSIENHDSGMYINNLARPSVGLERSTTDTLVTYRTDDTLSGGCMFAFRAGSGDHEGSCLEVSDTDDTEIFWRLCGDQINQKWFRERHWNDGQVFWERFHAARDDKLCLQQAFKGYVATPLAVRVCDGGWLQQWKVIAE